MQRLALSRRVGVLTLGLLMGCVGLALAQKRDSPAGKKEKDTPAGKRDVGGGEGYLSAAELKGADKDRFSDLRQGSKALSDQDKEKGGVLDKAAEFYVHRLTHPQYKNPDPTAATSSTRTMRAIVEEAFLVLPVGDAQKRLKDDQIRFEVELGRRMHERLKAVLAKNPEAITRVNAARFLARLVEVGVDEAADTCMALVNDKDEMDGVKFWALRGLRELMDNGKKDAPPTARQAKAAKTLLDFLARKAPTFPEGASSPEKDGFRYVRREAVRALGKSKAPRLAAGGQPAWDLLRVLGRDTGVSPEPSFQEQLEAAIGLCHFRSRLANANGPVYQPDYAAFYVGVLLVEFGNRYNEDFNQAKAKSETRVEPLMAWKYETARLTEALNAFKADNPGDSESGKYVGALVGKTLELLKNVDANRAADPNSLRVWLNNNPPKSDKLFSDDPGTVLKPAEAAASQ